MISAYERETEKLNDGRKGKFILDEDGHYLGVHYRPPFPNEPRELTRIVEFSSNLLGDSELEQEAIRNLYMAIIALREGNIQPDLANWVANALDELVHQVTSSEPDTDWDAREAFVAARFAGVRPKDRGRPTETPWKPLFLALDVEFARAAGSKVEAAAEKVGEFWRVGDDVIKKALNAWREKSREIVSTVIREDETKDIASASSIADHREGLRRWRDLRVG